MLAKRTLGKNGPEVGAIGYGAMVLEGYYGDASEEEGIRAIHHALDLGMNLIDSADAYGNGHNEKLIGQAIRGRRAQAFVATKFGIVFEKNEPSASLPTGWGFALPINGTGAYVRKALEASLQRLGTDVIDLYYAHFPDPTTPLEETVAAMAEAVQAGKVRYLGLCNVTSDEVRRAHKVHPITAVQYEYSLWRREVETSLLPTLRELGIGLVPWSPLGTGFLTGMVTDIGGKDFRQNNPKFSHDNLPNNIDRFAPLKAIAAGLDLTPAQLALAWLLHQGRDIVPIPGTRKVAHLDENIGSASVVLEDTILKQIDDLVPLGSAIGKNLLP
jgi:aryl-alcohol dehydrogenase-like predicted oxidoreductase